MEMTRPSSAAPRGGGATAAGPLRPRRPRVLFAMDWLDHELTLGIAQYAREAAWIVNDMPVHTGVPPQRWGGDGVIANLNFHEGRLVDFVRGLTCPVVDMSNETPFIRVPRVLIDDAGVGRVGAEHLLARGVQHLAFVRVWNTCAENDRIHGFREAVEQAGMPLTLLDGREMNSREIGTTGLTEWISRQVPALPRPLGVMCQHDRESMMVVNGCEMAGLAVPEDVAVVGVTNERMICELGTVPLS
ncbi:hypothetical protein EON77_09070, partial [bacterium]